MNTKQTEALKLALEAAYLAGFNDSAEGYNGEYPFRDYGGTPTKDRLWVGRRDEYIREALAEQPAQQPEQEPVASCQHKRYSVDVHEQTGRCFDCGAEGRMRFIVGNIAPAQQPEQEPVKFKCTVIDDANPNGVPLSQWECQSEQEPFCYHDGRNIVGKEYSDHSDVFPLYTAPQPRQWQGLTDDEIDALAIGEDGLPNSHLEFARAIEAKLREKNT